MAVKNPLLSRPKDMRYVDMCIWIDNHIYEPDCDLELAYSYMYKIAYMLGCKKKYFKRAEDYEGFASLVASSTYLRMTNPKKSKVKSVLNYMKSILYFRKIVYENSAYQEILDPEYTKKFDSDAFASRYRETLEAKNKEITKQATLDILSTVPLIIKSHIPASVKNNKLLCLNVYISCLLTMLNHLTLPTKYEPALERQLEKSPAFNEEAFYARHLDNEIILWSLDDSMLPLVKLIVKNTNDELISEIKSNISDAALSESDFNSIVASAMGVADETY